MTTQTPERSGPLASSFRDPSGYLIHIDGRLCRLVKAVYAAHYDRLMESGLYAELSDSGLLVRHEEIALPSGLGEDAYKLLRPELVPFISYPYEWCFSQYRDAALLTLDIAERAIAADMVLKDASAYNVQFIGNRPVFIDTLSFEQYDATKPWIAYGQFCRHFLAPLLLMSHDDARLNKLMRSFIDGVPLDLASKLLPGSTRFSPGILLHIHQHAASELKQVNAREPSSAPTRAFGKNAMLGLLDSLKGLIKKLSPPGGKTEWGDYYSDTNYTEAGFEAKKQLVKEFLAEVKPGVAWDLGANTGVMSQIAVEAGNYVVAFDIDANAVERNYARPKQSTLIPLIQDFSNPSASIGWANAERPGLMQRGPADTLLALAVIHHLAIGNNVPLPQIADWFADLGKNLIIEFVPKHDSQVKRLLLHREDIFTTYDQANFEEVMTKRWKMIRKASISETERTLYLFERKS
ncbi:MAG: SAM-dependent methyltransferase [Armatimonadetes bacterium]|nr:SAM-dependent methyltransferase [Armatimonadota bacterium]